MEKDVDKQRTKQLGGITGKGFVKGKSGNPAGRPKKKNTIPDILRKLTKQKHGTTSKLETILNNVVDNAINGDQWSIQFIADRMEGKPAQTIQQSVEDLPSGFAITRI